MAIPVPKLKVQERVLRESHRSGWGYALNALEPLCAAEGVLLDTFIESTFIWKIAENLRLQVAPYKEPWVGFLHNPVGIPEWHEYRSAPQVIFTQPSWNDSMRCCRGIITLSKQMADWLRQRLDVPILELIHPTEIPARTFRLESFLANPEPKIIQVGWWLRRLHSIHELPVRRLQRAILEPVRQDQLHLFDEALNREADALGLWQVDRASVVRIPYQSNDSFDELLASNLVLLHLYDSVANNSLVECIVRETPVLINPLPSVVEYLGAEYPFYFETLEEAARKAEDLGCVRAAHEYLKSLSKESYTGEYFRQSLAQSQLYQAL